MIEARVVNTKSVEVRSANSTEVEINKSPYISEDTGNWMCYDEVTGKWIDTGVHAKGDKGVSPTVATEAITGGTKVTITDKDGAHEFNVMNGEKGNMPPIVQTTGDSETDVMSQKAATANFALKRDITALQTALIGVSDLIGGDA